MKIVTTMKELEEVLGSPQVELVLVGLNIPDNVTITAERVDLGGCTGPSITIEAAMLTVYRSAFDSLTANAEAVSLYSSAVDVLRVQGQELALNGCNVGELYAHVDEIDSKDTWIGELVTDESTRTYTSRTYVHEMNYRPPQD
jgi:hypothetical protein